MKNMLKFVCICTLITTIGLLAIGCEKENTKSSIEKESSDYPITNIKWHLTSFTDVDKQMTVPPLNNHEQVYLLKFKDSTFEGHSFSNEIVGYITMDTVQKNMHFRSIGGTKINELFDGEKFIESLRQVQSYSTPDAGTLILYYNENRNYLQFEKVAE